MEVTNIFKQTGSLVAFSPGAHFTAHSVEDRLIVRKADSFQIIRTWLPDQSPSPTFSKLPLKSDATSGWITHLGWSIDSEFLLCACAKKGVVHVFKLRDEEWTARIDAGAEGLAKAEWAPDGRSVLCFSQWGLRITVWSLVSSTATYMQYPVHPDRGYAFRSDGRYFVLAERHKSKDTLGVYDAVDSYKLVRHFALPTSSLASLAISPTGNHIAVWEGSLEYKLVILTLTGDILATFAPQPDPGFGIRNVAWHPSGNFLAVGGWDLKIHVLDRLSWTCVATLELTPQVPGGVKIWREPSRWLESIEGRGFLSYEKLDGPHRITINRNQQSKAQPKSGTVQLEWNKTGDLLLVRFDNTPTAVHIFQFPASNEQFIPRLRSILIHNQPVLRARWNPVRKGSLAVCCGKSCLYMWSDEWVAEEGKEEEVAECVGIPARHFDTRDFKWSPDGKAMILLDKEAFCCAFEDQVDDKTK